MYTPQLPTLNFKTMYNELCSFNYAIRQKGNKAVKLLDIVWTVYHFAVYM